MQQHRTTRCASHVHREFTIQTAEASPIPDVAQILIDYFEDGVAHGTKFLPGQTVRLGWSVLRLCERSDGTIGVEERELTPRPTWTESVDRALADAWYQKEVCASVGLLEELTFPLQEDDVMVADCAMTADAILMTRFPDDDLPDGVSGWSLCCAENHDHGERSFVPLIAIAANRPGLVQFLALPHDIVVLIDHVKAKDAPAGTKRILPTVFRGGDELTPVAGSYLAALQG
ncbi:MAG: hypothetical protein H0T42_11720 [Deltaproteobacteria bacterium]|nr:hypothetical protein [Deltaproteobacteria bacterium]